LTRNTRNLRLAIALGVVALAVYLAFILMRVADNGV
jgi:hypothetical protein